MRRNVTAEEMTLLCLTRYKCDHKSLIAVVYKEGGGGRAYQIKSPSFVIDGGNYQQNRISHWMKFGSSR